MAKILVRFTQPPYANSESANGLDFALAATNYGHEVMVLFENKGVLQLLQSSSLKSVKNHSKRLAALPFFDIEECYVCAPSFKDVTHSFALGHSQFDSLIQDLEAQMVETDKKLALIERADHVVTF